ncbi:MAG: hypothetical protein AAGA92_07770 [Planctomycetota bacterium]
MLRNRRLTIESLEDRRMLSGTPPQVEAVTVSSNSWSPDFVDYLEGNYLGTGGYEIPTGSSAQSNPLPWIDLDTIKIRFSEDVHVDKQDLSITGVLGGQYDTGGFWYDPQTREAEWTLPVALPAGEVLHLDLDAGGVDAVTDLSGNALDGEWTNNVTSGASGDGVAGGDFEFRFSILEGDTWSSGYVNLFDYLYTYSRIGLVAGDPNYDPQYDVNGDAAIDNADFLLVQGQLGQGLPSGSAVGETDDAPTTTGGDYLSITDRDIDHAFSLFGAFDDLEDPDTSLTYSIVSQSAPELMDYVTIDAAAGTLIVNAVDSIAPLSAPATTGLAASTNAASSAAGAVGRNTVTVSATDQSGQSVEALFTVDVGRQNLPPEISGYSIEALSADVWEVFGIVSDPDDDVEGMIVELTGVFSERAVVRADGTFNILVIIPPTAFGWETATVADPHGGVSTSPVTWIGLT